MSSRSARRPATRRCTRGSQRRRPRPRRRAELRGRREGRELRPVTDLVGEAPAEPGEGALVAQEPVQPHRVVGEHGRELLHRDLVGFGAEAQRVWARARRRSDPHAGSLLLARLGEQQRACRRRTSSEPRRPAASAPASSSGLSRPPCMRCTTKVQRLEVEQQVLAPPADPHQRMIHRASGRRHRGLHRRERERRELAQDVAAPTLR